MLLLQKNQNCHIETEITLLRREYWLNFKQANHLESPVSVIGGGTLLFQYPVASPAVGNPVSLQVWTSLPNPMAAIDDDGGGGGAGGGGENIWFGYGGSIPTRKKIKDSDYKG